ncbi:ribosome small subunit-dependent GTPase A [Histidinibacterium aquaticum]|uniref:Small ribosomal subunit biogenesis GTPase RsgA n=1 Tax=Histidinibacterium aquaticum TaxID=2613962 RepID=A0A5J5GAX8_9RHOB|nr:ribosome small subunit-dependent GTPase A [Histidinibacterium aquaticum]KAA9005265.1 ribosome small subunit-dependent GTPase A [Histidinibacterium aquaticum]
MTHPTLADLGWREAFARQCDPADPPPARLARVDRDRVTALTPDGPLTLTCPPGLSTRELAVGDWVLHDPASQRIAHRLEPQTRILRRAAGREGRAQLIAANVDTLAIVSSCNADFNEARLERYLAVAAAADCLPLILLTKADLAEDPAAYRRRAARLSPLAVVETLDARDPGELGRLAGWCGPGQTLALVGSSGTGKTTITNGLTGTEAETRGIREDDAKGRHTTTARHLLRAQAGGWILDTPGMRELGLAEASEGIETVFSDLTELEAQCRFSDCRHETEPGCAVRAALEEGRLDPDRLARWEKLRREERHNSETIAEARARHKGFARVVKAAKARARNKGGLD